MFVSARDEKLIRKLIDKIKKRDFDENDIDLLFMRLRVYSAGYSLFREIADFVAHNDKRDRGITFDSLEAFSLSIRFFLDFNYKNKSLDIGSEMPAYIKPLLIYQLSKTDESKIDEFGFSKTSLEKEIKKHFKIENDVCRLTESQITANFFNAIKHLLSFIGSHPAYVQVDIISELIEILFDKEIIIESEKDVLRERQNEITVCILSLLHNTKFKFSGNHIAKCQLSSEKQNFYGAVPFEEAFGKLQLNGIIPVKSDTKELTVAYPVVSTELQALEWVSESILKKEMTGKNDEIEYLTLDFDCDTVINNDFRIERAD